jgi:hypothetical protein
MLNRLTSRVGPSFRRAKLDPEVRAAPACQDFRALKSSDCQYHHHITVKQHTKCLLRTKPLASGTWRPARVVASANADSFDSYNRLLAISGRVLRRSLKEDKRIQAERRGESELRVAFWKVSTAIYFTNDEELIELITDLYRTASNPKRSPSTRSPKRLRSRLHEFSRCTT